MEQRMEREWETIQCPRKEERTRVMCEWDVMSKGGRILRRILRQIDCHDPRLGVFGESDCDWPCQQIILKQEK